MPILPTSSGDTVLAQPSADLTATGALGGWWWRRTLRRAFDLLMTWQERSRQRRQLASLSDRMLRDIGLTRADVMAESTKPFWQR